MAINLTKTNWEYPHKDPNLEIVGFDGLVKVMIDLHGPNFEGSVYNPRFNNIRTGKVMANAHHCTHNDRHGHDTARSCITKGHQSYCLEWVTEGLRRMRCGLRLAVVSGGCGAHPNSMDASMNLLVKNLKEGKIPCITWGQLNDPERVEDTAKDPAERAREENAAIMARHDAELAAMGDVSVVAVGRYSLHGAFEQRKIQRQRAEDEQRRIMAAQRRSCITGKFVRNKKKTADENDVPPMPELSRGRFGKSIMKLGKKGNRLDASKWAGKSGGVNA
ncbi:hypothetical protein N0V86_007000 [Didymella sp. IMI 355093]|nr:hypothetical protein N0V86_007000 [Didymella sp. IMI 355093]